MLEYILTSLKKLLKMHVHFTCKSNNRKTQITQSLLTNYSHGWNPCSGGRGATPCE
jgi:CDP-diacylglycerol pyrophosphatase